MLEEIRTFTAVQLAEKIKIREISVIEAVKATLEHQGQSVYCRDAHDLQFQNT